MLLTNKTIIIILIIHILAIIICSQHESTLRPWGYYLKVVLVLLTLPYPLWYRFRLFCILIMPYHQTSLQRPIQLNLPRLWIKNDMQQRNRVWLHPPTLGKPKNGVKTMEQVSSFELIPWTGYLSISSEKNQFFPLLMILIQCNLSIRFFINIFFNHITHIIKKEP